MKNLSILVFTAASFATLLAASGVLLWRMAGQERILARLRAVQPGAERRQR